MRAIGNFRSNLILTFSPIAGETACRTVSTAKELASQLSRPSNAISLDVSDFEALSQAVSQHDLVISLIPYTHHATVIKAAIRHKKNVVTTSYVSDAMKELEGQVKEAGIVVLNEVGLDPGIDHLYAVKTIDEVHKAGGKVRVSPSECERVDVDLTAAERFDPF